MPRKLRLGSSLPAPSHSPFHLEWSQATTWQTHGVLHPVQAPQGLQINILQSPVLPACVGTRSPLATPPPAYQWGCGSYAARDLASLLRWRRWWWQLCRSPGGRVPSLKPVPSLQGSCKGSQHCWRQFQPKQGYLLGARSAWTSALPWAGGLASGSCSPGTAGSSRLKPVHLLAEQSECHGPSQPFLGTDNSPASLGLC